MTAFYYDILRDVFGWKPEPEPEIPIRDLTTFGGALDPASAAGKKLAADFFRPQIPVPDRYLPEWAQQIENRLSALEDKK